MKRLSFILAAVLLVLGLAQCKKEKTQAQGSGETIVQQVTVGASCNGSNSKVDGQIIGNALKLTWDEGDVIEVGIPEKSGLSTLTLSSPAGETSGKFTGTITGQTGDKLTFLYKADNSKIFLDNEGCVNTDEAQFMNQNGKLEKTDDSKASDKNSILDRLCAYVENIDFIASDAAEYSVDLEVPYAILKLDLSAFGTTEGTKVSISAGGSEVASVTGVTNATDNPYYVAVPAYGSKEYTFSGNGKTAKVTWKLEKNIYYTKSDGNGGSTGEAIVVVAPIEDDWIDFNDPAMGVTGLPIWSKKNLGATCSTENPTDPKTATTWYGDYYAWGEVEPYYADGHAYDDPCENWKTGKTAGYNWASYKWCNGSYNTLTKYNTSSSYGTVDNKTTLEDADDAARAELGGSWRMPTGGASGEWQQLASNTYFKWEYGYNGIAGLNGFVVYKVKDDDDKGLMTLDDNRDPGDPSWATYNQDWDEATVQGDYTVSDPHMFLPAAGFFYGTSLNDAGSRGSFWSSSLYSDGPSYAWGMYFLSGRVSPQFSSSRCRGFSVRPVQ